MSNMPKDYNKGTYVWVKNSTTYVIVYCVDNTVDWIRALIVETDGNSFTYCCAKYMRMLKTIEIWKYKSTQFYSNSFVSLENIVHNYFPDTRQFGQIRIDMFVK